jgi:hypothetical protein
MGDIAPINRSKRQWVAVAKARVAKGEPGTSVESEFVTQGLDAPSAKEIVDEAVRGARSRATGWLVGSGLFAALGLFVTIASYFSATSGESDGTYWIWYGPIAAGGIVFLVALTKLLSIRR